MATPNPQTAKPIHSLILDTGPLIKNDPPASTLRAKAEQLYTLPCIISEIRDAATRSRVETTLLPFVTLRSPKPESVRFVREFARKTGDLAVLSKPDIDVLALGYELECERNGGDWRLRNAPGQQRLNGKPPLKDVENEAAVEEKSAEAEEKPTEEKPAEAEVAVEAAVEAAEVQPAKKPVETEKAADGQTAKPTEPLEESVHNLTLDESKANDAPAEQTETPSDTVQADEVVEEVVEEEEDDGDASDDEGGWITPSNLKKHQSSSPASSSTPPSPVQRTLQAAVLTSDYAMQNVALRMNLNLVAPSLARVTHLKSWVLRCHGCFAVTKDTTKQFCPKCGQPTLLRTSCSTDEHGQFRLHLKRNFQWNNRGNVYSVPRPVHGSANGRLPRNAAGKGNWGADLVFAEDQKEYTRAGEEQRRSRKKDIMDQDYLPGILSGDRSGSGGKIRVGAGRNVNSKKKR